MSAAGFGATAFYDSSAGGGAGGAQYSQIVQKQVDSRLKHFSFYEDTRPPYCGMIAVYIYIHTYIHQLTFIL